MDFMSSVRLKGLRCGDLRSGEPQVAEIHPRSEVVWRKKRILIKEKGSEELMGEPMAAIRE